uniref:DUF3615 domain-containing protein n=1 Tax=Oryza punctata TaxID=4537 RepID=A0A0E0KCG7_ORYPU
MSTLHGKGKGKRKRPEQPASALEAEAKLTLILHRKMGCINMLSQSQLSSIKMLLALNNHLKLCYNLRNRNVFVPDNDKPKLGPLQYKKGKEPVYDVSWQTPTCAKVALEHYNRSNEDEYEMVKVLDSVSSFFNGVWVHVNFLAKLKGATQCPDLVPMFFFAEVKTGLDGIPKATPIRGCGICQNNAIFHPAAGGHRGDRKSVC